MVLSRRSLLRPLSAALVPSAFWVWPGAARSQAEALCDPGLPQLRDHPYGYKVRGDRCEGLFAREVSAGALRIVGYGRHVEDFDASAGPPLRLRWQKPPMQGTVHVRVNCLRPRMYFRMDTQAPVARGEFAWQPGLVAALSLRRGDLAVLAWLTQNTADGPRRVLLPVDLLQRADLPGGRPLRILATSDTEVAQWLLRLSPESGTERPAETVSAAGYFPPGSAVELPLPPARNSAVCRLELMASLRDGGVSSTESWVYAS